MSVLRAIGLGLAIAFLGLASHAQAVTSKMDLQVMLNGTDPCTAGMQTMNFKIRIYNWEAVAVNSNQFVVEAYVMSAATVQVNTCGAFTAYNSGGAWQSNVGTACSVVAMTSCSADATHQANQIIRLTLGAQNIPANGGYIESDGMAFNLNTWASPFDATCINYSKPGAASWHSDAYWALFQNAPGPTLVCEYSNASTQDPLSGTQACTTTNACGVAGTPTWTPTATPSSTPAICGNPNLCNDALVYNGTARKIAQGEVQLTNGGTWQAGTAWDPNTLDLNQNFNFSFQMYFGSIGTGADGMTFTLQRVGTGAIGNAGGDLGIDTQPVAGGPSNSLISPAVSVEFDTYQNNGANPPPDLDPAFDHIMIDENGSVMHTGSCPASITTSSGACPVQAGAAANIKDGAWHSVQVAWTASSHVLQVFFDGSLRLTYTKDIVNQIFGGNNCAYVGFTGATGGATNDQRVRICNTPLQAPCGSPTMDGSLADAVWATSTYKSIALCTVATCPGTGGTAQYKMLWDATNLYMAFDVTDPNLFANGGAPWNGSAVEIFFDFDHNLGGSMDGSDMQWVIPWDSSTVAEYRNGALQGTIGSPTNGITKFSSNLGGGHYTMEVAIPWANIGVAAPSAGAISGIDAGVDFSNAALNARDHQFGGRSPGNAPALWDSVQYGSCGTPTPTYTQTPVYSPTISPSPSNSPSRTNTFTFSPTISPTYTPSGCGAAPTFGDARMIGSGCIGGGPAFSFAYTVPVLSNQLLIIRIEETQNGNSPTAVQFGGQAMTLLSTGAHGAPNLWLFTYYLYNPPTGTLNLTFNHVGGNCNWNIAAERYTGVDPSNPVGTFNTILNGTSDAQKSLTLTVTTIGNNSVISEFMASDQVCNAGDLPVGWAGQNSFNLRTTGVVMACCECVFGDYKAVGAAGTYQMSYTLAQTGRYYSAAPIEIRGLACTPTPTYTPSYTFTASPTVSPTVSQTVTPRMGLTKTSNLATASIGDTLTFCLQWSNDASATTPINIWDSVSTYVTYLGCSNTCTKTAQTVAWTFNAASGASGSVCFWGTVNGYPWWPHWTDQVLAIRPRDGLRELFLGNM